MIKRKIIHIDEEKCDGCGLCIPACHEGAIRIIDGKARLVEDKLCDGLGDCLGECPQDAIKIIERAAEEFNEEAVKENLAKIESEETDKYKIPCDCSSVLLTCFDKEEGVDEVEKFSNVKSTLKQWPVQISLLPIEAPFFKDADLMVVADCVPFALAEYHQLQRGKVIAVGCPKLDDGNFYVQKLGEIFTKNNIVSITILRMEVPCCGGLSMIIKEALKISNKDISIEIKTINAHGKILE